MEFIWAGKRDKRNTRLVFKLPVDKEVDLLTVCAVDFFQIFVDREFKGYGPVRTAAGHIRPYELKLENAKEIIIKVISYNVWTYCNDLQTPFFGAEVSYKNELVYSTRNFVCYIEGSRKDNVPRFSRQRGFLERYDFCVNEKIFLDTYSVDAPIIINAIDDVCDYNQIEFIYDTKGVFKGFSKIQATAWQEHADFAPRKGDYDVDSEFIERVKEGFEFCDYHLKEEHTGFVKLIIEAKEDTEVFAVFDEFLPDNNLYFRRSRCNDFIVLKFPKGRSEFISQEPYALKFLKIIYKGNADIMPKMITVENDRANAVVVSGNSDFVKIFNAAKNTFKQNAVDIFMDCPGRERAGWLCDSYFTAIAERLFTGNNNIEKAFLENIIMSKTPEIPEEMVPKCFPGEHADGEYIPNWSMWFVIECRDYILRSNDLSFKERAKERIYKVVRFFDKYLNEFGLLENLESWVFLEWSICNNPDYKCGLSFPSNMLYAYMLDAVAKTYGDKELESRAKSVRQAIIDLSYNGELFCENAIRVNGKLKICKDHLSETCQYYALFTGICPDDAFKYRMMNEFGPSREERMYPEIGKSNMFIGNYLRLFWLCKERRYEQTINECFGYFLEMAEKTGTLWEMNSPTSSCNHGFASVAAVIMLYCGCGYLTVENDVPVFMKDFSTTEKYGVKANFSYGDKSYEKEF